MAPGRGRKAPKLPEPSPPGTHPTDARPEKRDIGALVEASAAFYHHLEPVGRSKGDLRMRRHSQLSVLLMGGLLAGGLASSPARAQSVEEFYKGKTINFIIGYSPGGGYDIWARLVARHIGNHIPGKPQVVPRNMPGASSRAAAASMFAVQPKDGTALATGDQSLSLAQAMGENIQFDTTKFIYIGNPNAENNTTAAWHTTGIKTIEDVKQKELPVGATGGSTSS